MRLLQHYILISGGHTRPPVVESGKELIPQFTEYMSLILDAMRMEFPFFGIKATFWHFFVFGLLLEFIVFCIFEFFRGR